MSKYLDPKADLTFKKIFGEHPNLVISLLNALLPLKEDERVETIEYWPAEKIPERTVVEKYSIVDVCCRDNKGREFIVEMQMTWTESFKKRVLFNASKAYVAQSEKGMNYESLQPVYALNFVNTNFMNDVDDYYHYFRIVHDKYTDEVIDGLQLIFVELRKFKPQSFSERKMQVLWLRFLTEINEKIMEAPKELLENPDVREALEIVEKAAFTDAEMRSYDKFWDRVSTQRTFEEETAKKAQRMINEAQEKAKKAQEKANEAQEKANEAQEKANEAQEKAKKAEEKANEAQEKAKKAEERANMEEERANKAQARANKAEEKIKEAEEKIKEAEERTLSQKLEIARKMKALGANTEFIIQATGLGKSEIESI